MSKQTFDTKWSDINTGKGEVADEKSLFVPVGQKPITQRQLNLYYYFLFIKNILSRSSARDVLEAGCGRGTISLYLAQHMGLSLTLLDNVPDAIELAKKDFKERGLAGEFFVEDVLKTHFPDSSFDSVVSIGLAEHFEKHDVEQLFAEQFRILRSGGVMISLNIPKKFSIQFLNTVMRSVKKMFGLYKESVNKDYFRNTYTAEEFQDIALRVGFTNTSITHVCPFPIYVPVTMKTDKFVTRGRRFILRVRSLFQNYPYKTNRIIAQAHFLVAYKK